MGNPRLGEGFNFHTPHWHGNTVLVNGQRTDIIALSPAQMVTADMVPQRSGNMALPLPRERSHGGRDGRALPGLAVRRRRLHSPRKQGKG